MLKPHPAGPADAEAIWGLREAAARWLVGLGLRQWEPGEVTLAEVKSQVRDRQWWVVRGHGAGARGAIRLVDQDLETWGPTRDRALYVHGLVIAREEVGAGLGAAMLRWVETVAAQQNVVLVRLDAVESNERLRAYYRERGFREVGRATFDDPRWYPAVLLEKRVDVSVGDA